VSEVTEVRRTPEERRQGGATHRAIEGVRALIMEHKMLPGQQVRQEEIAAHLGLSRSPVREALRALEAEGLLIHTANHGYFVVRLSADEMHQIYLMRGVIEAAVLRRIVNVSADDIAELHAINNQLRNAIEAQSINQMLEANRRFHFKIFSLSKMGLVQNYLEQLWHLSESYRATYLWLRETRERIVNEHDLMMERLEAKDFEGLVRAADEHRSHAEARVVELLPREDGFHY
jgi:DNA-binding GntR family transcriptional regulator